MGSKSNTLIASLGLAMRSCALNGAQMMGSGNLDGVSAAQAAKPGIASKGLPETSGVRIKSFRRAWVTACKKAGIPERVPHDFRRTAVRNLERAGVPRSTAMKMVGHRTESIYRRYAIVSEGDLREAAQKLAAIDRGTWNGGDPGSHPGHEPEGVQNTLAQHQVAGGPRRRSTDGGTKQ